jgi:hypothetical protein
MKKKSFLLSLCFVTFTGAMYGAVHSGSARVGNNSKQQAATQKTSQDNAKQPRIDPGALLSSNDVQAVQGDPVQETKPSTQAGGGLVMSQCLFRTTTPSKSISVAIASPGAVSSRRFWQKQFHSGKPAPDEKEKSEKKPVAGQKKQEKEEEQDESTRPRAVAGVGEEAYWVGSPMVGALYVLKGNTFLRISVGGVREESARIEKSVALARLAMKHLVHP